jgi:hypothetical protein
MANQPNDYLYQLIRSLSKAEKRSFKIYALRSSSEEAKFIQLFDAIDKAKEYDEDLILQKLEGVKKTQLSNLKAHLYRQLLTSLRLNYTNHNIDIQLREQIDYARILYDKGLYKQSLKILDKAKLVAHDHHRVPLSSEILGFEKLIESQYITRSFDHRADNLIDETQEVLKSEEQYHQLSNLALRLYSLYIKTGHVRNEADYERIHAFFEQALSSIQPEKMGFYEQLYLQVSHAWYNLIVQDFLAQYRHAQKWVDHFRNHPAMLQADPIWYLKGMHVLLEALFILGHYDRHNIEMQNLKTFLEDPPSRSNTNLETLGWQYYYTSQINHYFMNGHFEEGTQLIPALTEQMDTWNYRIDSHRILVFHYKIACLYFGAGDLHKCIHHLGHIIQYPDPHLREDLHCFARILTLIAHIELGNEQLVQYQVRSTYRFLRKMDDLNSVQEEVLSFLRALPHTSEEQLQRKFKKLHTELIKIQSKPFQKRAFLYLDIISWLEAKMNHTSVQEVISAKFAARKPH